MINNDTINNTKNRIQYLVLSKVNSGIQNNDLNSDIYVSCGQFLDPSTNQRGLHGSIAALSILLDKDNNNNNKLVIPKLTSYIMNFTSIEENLKKKNVEKVKLNEKNVIKISETIIEFCRLRRNEDSVNKYIANLVMVLKNCNKSFNWPFYCGEEKLDMLPTSFVALALNEYGETTLIDQVTVNLRNYLTSQNSEIKTNPIFFAKYVFATFVFSKIIQDENSKDEKIVKDSIKIFINSPFYNMKADVEQMIQYSFKSDHSYISIPWQLYSIELLSKYDIWSFSNIHVQERLNSICNSVLNSEFYYPSFHSSPSTRTYSIINKLLSNISISLSQSFLIQSLNWIGNIRKFLSSKWVIFILAILSIIFILISIFQWFNDPDSKIADVAPEFLGSFSLFLLAIRSK